MKKIITKKKKHLLLLFVLFSTLFPLFSQQEASLPSPQTADFMRLTGGTVAKNTGRLNFGVSFFALSTPTFTMPVGISYNSAGFMPLKNPGIVGMDWALNVGGVITREVRGIPDDRFEDSGNFPYPMHGMLYFAYARYSDVDFHLVDSFYTRYNLESMIKGATLTSPVTSNDSLCYFDFSKAEPQYNPNNESWGVEVMSDIYHFNFGGISGKFIIGYDGKPKVISNNSGIVKVDISEYLMDNYRYLSFPNPPGPHVENMKKTATIEITDDKGYTYHFGGDNNALEYTVPLKPASGSSSSLDIDVMKGSPITAFHLSTIISPQGDSLKIEYEKLTTEQVSKNNFSNNKQHYNFSHQVATSIPYYKKFTHSTEYETGVSQSKTIASLTKTARIKTITAQDQEIKFFYNAVSKPFFSNIGYSPFSDCGSKLETIHLISKVDNSVKKKVTFQYDNTNRMYLEKVIVDDKEYSFEYYEKQTFDPSAFNADHWGFNTIAYAHLKPPKFRIIDGKTIEFESFFKEPGLPSETSFGLLKKVIFPTKGFMEIEYESHQYGARVDMLEGQKILLPGIAGGARVKKIIQSDGEKTVTKAFDYFKADGSSSGIVLNCPSYFYNATYIDHNGQLTFQSSFTYTSFNINPFTYGQDHVMYSQVRETMVESVKKDYPMQNLANLGNYKIKYNSASTAKTDSFVIDAPRDLFIYFGASAVKTSSRTEPTIVSFERTNQLPESYILQGDTNAYFERKSYFFPKGKTTVKITQPPNTTANNTAFEAEYAVYCPMTEYNGPYTISYYTDYFSHPDIHTIDYIYSPYRIPEDHSVQRGKLSKLQSYDKSGIRVQETRYGYAYNTAAGMERIGVQIFPDPFGASSQPYKIPLYAFNLMSDTTIVYDKTGANPIQTVTTRSYNDKNLVSTSTLKDSYDRDVIVTYSYPFDIASTLYETMTAKNMLNYLVKEVTTTGTAAEELSTSYKNFSTTTPARIMKEFITTKIGAAPPRTAVQYLKYDSYGNPVYLIENGVNNIVYIWGYKGAYQVAKILNATYDEVKTALGNTNPEDLSTSTSSDYTKLNNLRNNLPNAQVSIYKYNPLVGVTEATDPRGIKTTYSYDPFNRLLNIKDHNGKTLESYESIYRQ
jgi:YD repeat-containing protein